MKKSGIGRRGFLKGMAGVGVGTIAATGMMAAGCATGATNSAVVAQTWDYEVDIAVAGFGMGGAMASLQAQKEGVKVLCAEAYSQYGGTSVDSGGGASAPTSMEAAMRSMPYGDYDLLETFVDGMPLATELMVELGAPMRRTGAGFTLGLESNHASRLECFNYLAKAFVDGGGTLLLDTKVIKLLTDDQGAITGMQAKNKEGAILNIKAKAVILACGGFQNNSEMKTKYFGPYGDQVVCRAVPTNDGTGILMAQEIGAGLSKSLGSFYGHSVASNIEHIFMEFNYITSQYHDNRSIVVNLDGVRFADEGMGLAGDLNNESLARQRWGRGCVIFDQNIYDRWGSTTAGGTPTGIDRVQAVLDRGSRTVSANTIEELAEKMAAWGYNRASIIKTVTEYNAAVDANTTADLAVPRTAGQIASIVKLAQPPFWATEVISGVSCCYGGLAINPKTEVLKNNETNSIPGLYAVPGTAGGATFVNYYVSSIGAAAAYGFVSAVNAVEYSKTRV